MKKTKLFGLILMVSSFVSCMTHNRMLKNPDIDARLNYAIDLYEKGKFYKAIPFFEGLYRDAYATTQGEEVMFYLSYSYYGSGNYGLASIQFEEYSRTYPNSERAEESDFMAAYCSYLLSPPYSNSPEETEKAIEQIQFFVNKYPMSERISESNQLMDELIQKLEKKYFEIANFYFDIEDYRAASYAYRALLDKYPETPFREQIMWNMTKSDILLSFLSVEERREERTKVALKSFEKFQKRYPDNEDLKELQTLVKKIQYE